MVTTSQHFRNWTDNTRSLFLNNNFECCCTSLPPCTMLRTPCNYDHCNFPTSSPIDDDDDDEETPEPEKELEDYEVALAIIIPAATVVGVIFLAVYLVSRSVPPDKLCCSSINAIMQTREAATLQNIHRRRAWSQQFWCRTIEQRGANHCKLDSTFVSQVSNTGRRNMRCT
jgi:hypothetical protein